MMKGGKEGRKEGGKEMWPSCARLRLTSDDDGDDAVGGGGGSSVCLAAAAAAATSVRVRPPTSLHSKKRN